MALSLIVTKKTLYLRGVKYYDIINDQLVLPAD